MIFENASLRILVLNCLNDEPAQNNSDMNSRVRYHSYDVDPQTDPAPFALTSTIISITSVRRRKSLSKGPSEERRAAGYSKRQKRGPGSTTPRGDHHTIA